MSEAKTPVAGKKEPQTGTRTVKRNAGTTININTMGDSKPGRVKPEAEQHTDTTPAVETPEPQDPPRPPIFSKHVSFNNAYNGRETHYATPLAATLFARFDENYSGVQPCEFAVFVDSRLKRNGYI